MHCASNKIEIKRITQERKKIDGIWFGAVFLFALNFMAMPNHLLLGVIFVGVMVAGYKKSKFKATLDLLPLWLFSITYYITLVYYGHGGGLGKLFVFMIGPITSFIIGYSVVKETNDFIFKTILAVVFGNLVHGLLNMALFFQLYGFKTSIIGIRRFPDIWLGVKITATLQGAYYTQIASLLFYSIILLINKKRKRLALVIIISIIFSLMASFIMGNRTLMVVVIISFISCFIIYSRLINNHLWILKFYFVIVILGLTVYLTYVCNILGVKAFVEGSTWYMRSNNMVITEDPRALLYQRAISQMFDFPFGGYSMDLGSSSYVHNLWLDVLYATGLIPFIFLCWYTMKSITNLVKLLKQKNTDIEFKIFVFSIYVGVLLNFMVEPILEGAPYMFISFCLINGIIRKQIDLYKKTYLKTGRGKYENTLVNKHSVTRS